MLTVCILVLGGLLIEFGFRLQSGSGTGISVSGPNDASDTKQQRMLHQSFQQGVHMLQTGQFEYAVTALHQVLGIAPTMPEAHVNMGYALLGLGRDAAARDFFLSATELRPQQHNAYYGLALANERLNDIAAAAAAMQVYVHLGTVKDSHLEKARAAIREWQKELDPVNKPVAE